MGKKLSDRLSYAASVVVGASLAALVFGVMITLDGALRAQGGLPLLYAVVHYFGANQEWILVTSSAVAVFVAAWDWFGRK